MIGIAIAALSFSANEMKAQTVSNAETTVDHIIDLVGSPTNYAAEIYGTYAPKAPTKLGGGLFVAYNFNNYVGAGIGFDWLGNWNLVNGSITLKAPFHITKFLPFNFGTNSWVNTAMLTPYARAGIATAYSGAGSFNGAATVDTALGVYLKFGHLWGGEFNVGGDYAKWQGSGAYDVPRYHFFAGWSKGF